MLSMWEFGMDGGRYDAIEFRNSHVTLPALDDDSVQPESLLSRSPLQINATTKCISAAHTILDCFSTVSVDKMRRAPNLLYVRAAYALVTLMKADYAVGTDAEMGELLESQSLKVGHYLETVLRKTDEAMGPQKCRNPTHWSYLLKAKLKSWWDEYQEWRKEERNFKRRRTDKEDRSDTATGNQTPVFAEPKTQDPVAMNVPSTTQHETPSMPDFSMGHSFSTWNANEMPLGTSTASQPIADQATFTPDMGEFSAAFQNGDLYLWNDVSVDNFGGWIPQSGPYSTMGFPPMSGQGF